jgi:patatin-related protein
MAEAPGVPITSYETEHRLAVVMYGGVSLAIYIGGVAKELLSVVRATASGPTNSDASNSNRAGVPNVELKGAEAVYRRIAQTTSGPVAKDLDERPILRNVTIDVISGTSAGGINGIFLAKALANGQSLDPILNLWIEEGDMAKLLNDGESVFDTHLALQDPPVSLLNGRRMYAKLVDAFDAMDGKSDFAFDAGRVDLFVPTTDIRGEVIQLPLANTTAREKRHRQRFHFTCDPSSNRNEFENDRNLILAYAARCTSSFPFAFEPFTWSDALDAAKPRDKRKADQTKWKTHLMYEGQEYEKRPMGDGGYLDNKPFSYAIDELARRQSDMRVTRTLFYVEPDPERLDSEKDAGLQSKKPDAIENAMAALISIPGYETIREDLERVVGRNARVAKLQALEAVIDEFASAMDLDSRKDATLDELTRKFGVGYRAYDHIKLEALIESLADLICTSSGIGRPEMAQVVRELVQVWIRFEYKTPADRNQLLLDADIDYRIRKIAFVLRKAANLPHDAAGRTRQRLKCCYDEFYRIRRTMRKDIGEIVEKLRQKNALSDQNLAKIVPLRDEARAGALEKLLHDVGADLRDMPEGRRNLKEYFRITTRPDVIRASDAASEAIQALDERIAAYYWRFESFDMVMFPLVHHDGVDEAVPVEVVRISPFDSKLEKKVKLGGVALGHFGGFLEAEWRRNDIVAGRFNAAEAIIRQLVSDPDEATALVREAHEAIANELIPELERRVAVAKLKEEDRLEIPEQRQVAQAVHSVLSKDRLPDLLIAGEVYDLGTDRAKQLRSAGRAGVIIEQILRSAALEAKKPFPGVLRWSALGAMVMTQIAIPRSFHRTVANYWGRLLALIFAVMAFAGYVAGNTPLLYAGIKGFAVVAIIAGVVLLLSRWVGERFVATVIRIGAWAAVLSAAWYAAHTSGIHLPSINTASVKTNLTTLSPTEIFFIGVGLGFLLMSGLLAVLEDTRASIRWTWTAIKALTAEATDGVAKGWRKVKALFTRRPAPAKA